MKVMMPVRVMPRISWGLGHGNGPLSVTRKEAYAAISPPKDMASEQRKSHIINLPQEMATPISCWGCSRAGSVVAWEFTLSLLWKAEDYPYALAFVQTKKLTVD